MDHIQTNTRSSEKILGYSAIASSLKADLVAVLRSYVGKQVLALRPPDSVPVSVRSPLVQQITGTVVNSFIEKEKAYVVVEWHVTASKTIISLQQFVQSGQFKVVERVTSASSSALSRPCPLQLKRRGVMKYT